MSRLVRCTMLAAALTAACGGDTGSGPGPPPQPAPPPPAPPPRALTVSFVKDTVSVREGDTAEISVRWEVRELANPLRLEVSPLGVTADVTDYELAATTVTVPAGSGTTGTEALSLTAIADSRIAEGDETLALRLVPPSGPRAELGPDLEVTISDAAAGPCAGTSTLATPVRPAPGAGWIETTLDIDFGPGSESIWIEPYAPLWKQAGDKAPILLVHATEWRVEHSGGGVRHSMDLEWPAADKTAIRFRSTPDGGCAGEPEIRCDAGGCELVP